MSKPDLFTALKAAADLGVGTDADDDEAAKEYSRGAAEVIAAVFIPNKAVTDGRKLVLSLLYTYWELQGE